MATTLFVGRERELARLREAFDAACAGEPRVVMLAGEPGIGKTRLAEELAEYASASGALVLWGRAQEFAGTPPYWPWVQVGRAYRAATHEATRREEWTPYAVELQRIFPGLRELFPDLPEPAPAESPEAQFRLFDAMSGFLHAVSSRVPLLLVLDDLHWADRSTLLMLGHVARELAGARLLLVGAYRDTDLDRIHPLAEVLAELNRERLFERLHLRGLSEAEVIAFVQGAADAAPRSELLARIYEETEGNPFFLSEVVTLMAAEGVLAAGDGAAEIAVPEGVREVLGRRLNRLSPEANGLLTLAAVVGREFDEPLLTALTDHDGEAVNALLDEALRTRIVEESGTAGEYRFAHALMRETLLAELSASRRVRLHAEIAEALERLEGETSTERVAELAAHYAESAALSRAHARKAAHYLRLAAEQAEGQYAWAEAARHYERCVPLLEQGDELQLAEVLHAHGRAAWGAGDWRGAGSILVRALDIYRKHEEHVAFARVALDLLRTPAPAAQHQAIVGEALQFAPQLAPELEARLRAGLLFVRPEELDDATTAARVQELSSTLALPDVEARLLFARLLQTPPSDGEEAERLARTMIARFQEAGERVEAVRSQQMLCAVIFWSGDLDRAAREYAAWLHDCERLGVGWSAGVARTALAEIHLLRNDMEQHEEARRAISAERLGFDLLPAVRAERAGALDEAVRLLPPRETAGGVPGFMSLLFGCRARILLRAGRREEARQEFEAWWDASKHLTYTLFLPGMCIEECLTEFGTREAVELAYRRTGELSWRRYIPLAHLSNDRARGMLALHLGLLNEAEQHYRAGVEWSERERCPVELGRCHQGLAEVAERRGDSAAAREHLETAAEQFTRIDAWLYLDQVQAKLAALPAGAAARPQHPDGLSRREVEVLRLLAAGLSNREIAEELVISLRTVERHVANIYRKIDVHRRTQAAAYARHHGFDTPGEPTAT